MNFLADTNANRVAGSGAELSLEEALAFFDGYDDHSLHHTQSQQQQQQHIPQQQQQHSAVATVSSSSSHDNAQMYHHQQQQQFGMTTATDMLMMMDDPVVAPSDFMLGDASVNAFLYSTPTATSAAPSCANAAMLDTNMSYNTADFGLMASMLQPLHLDDPSTALQSDALVSTLPSETSPMQTLLAAPLTPVAVVVPAAPAAPAASAAAAPVTTTRTTTRPAVRSGRTQRVKSDPQTSTSMASAAASAPRSVGAATRAAPKAAGMSASASASTSGSTGPGRVAMTASASNTSSTKRVRRQKEELLYLRAKVVEMEERLQQLKRVNGENCSARGSPAPSSSDDPDSAAGASPAPASSGSKKRRNDESSETDDDAQSSTESSSSSAALSPPAISPALLASVWENVAERQYKERLRAEQQNKKLKTMLEGQIKLATSLEKILKKRPNMEVLYPDTDLTAAGASQRVITYNESDADVFAKQLADVEDAFPRTDDVLAASGFFTDGDESVRHDFRVKDYPDDNGVIMEFMAATTVPYDLDITGNALWRFMSDVAVKKHCYFEEVVESTDDRVSRSFGVRMCENGEDVDMRGKHTLRKYVARDRVVLVWASLMEPLQIAGAHVAGLRFNDIGWLVAQRAVSQQGATLIKAYGNLSPLLPADTGDDEQQDARIGVLTDFVINSHESNAALCLQLMNDLLVEEEWKSTLPVVL